MKNSQVLINAFRKYKERRNHFFKAIKDEKMRSSRPRKARAQDDGIFELVILRRLVEFYQPTWESNFLKGCHKWKSFSQCIS